MSIALTFNRQSAYLICIQTHNGTVKQLQICAREINKSGRCTGNLKFIQPFTSASCMKYYPHVDNFAAPDNTFSEIISCLKRMSLLPGILVVDYLLSCCLSACKYYVLYSTYRPVIATYGTYCNSLVTHCTITIQ